MNYSETIAWLFAQLPMYQRVGGANYKINLEKTHALMALLNHPENGFKSIHVAGTNGKGSTSHMLASVLQEKGLKVGLYTSPHLKDFRERIKINGQMIDEQAVLDFVANHKTEFVNLELSFFEMTVGLAFDYFKKQNVDIAIVEVGMGGRLDSTNVLSPLVSIITNIGLDHTQFLGGDLPSIAAEKAGIIKDKTPVIIGKTQPETMPIFKDIAAQKKAPIFYADQIKTPKISSDLKGNYQDENKATAFVALQHLPSAWQPNAQEIERGYKNVVKNTGLQGRWQTLQEMPLIICDTGHNKDGILQILPQIKNTPCKQLRIVWGMVNDKQPSEVLAMLPKNAIYYFARPNLPRGLDAEIVQKAATELGLKSTIFTSVAHALENAKNEADDDDFIFVGGSTFVVAEVV